MNRLSVGRKVALYLLEHPKAMTAVRKVYKGKIVVVKGYRQIVRNKDRTSR
jgi:hypothetical protein